MPQGFLLSDSFLYERSNPRYLTCMIVITGGAGFIGSALLWKLNQDGRDDVLLVDPLSRHENRRLFERARFLDTRGPWNFIAELEAGKWDGKIETVFHLGACSSTLEEDEAYLHMNNTYYSQRLAIWAIQHGVRLIYASSGATYGNGVNAGFDDNPARLSWLKPLNPYGWSKHRFDLWLRDQGYLQKVVGLKFFNVYGPNETFKGAMASMVLKAFYQIQATGYVQLFRSYRPGVADGEQKRDFIYVKDCVDTLVWLSVRKDINGLFNLGTGVAHTWNELVLAVFGAMNLPSKIYYIDMPEQMRSAYQYLTCANMDRLKKYGWSGTQWTLETGVCDYVRKYLIPMERPLSF